MSATTSINSAALAKDWTRARIRYHLEEKAGVTYRDLDRANKLPDTTCAKAAGVPHEAGELAISQALGIPPFQIWPSRFSKSGRRLSPQPRKNYRRRPSNGLRQKGRTR